MKILVDRPVAVAMVFLRPPGHGRLFLSPHAAGARAARKNIPRSSSAPIGPALRRKSSRRGSRPRSKRPSRKSKPSGKSSRPRGSGTPGSPSNSIPRPIWSSSSWPCGRSSPTCGMSFRTGVRPSVSTYVPDDFRADPFLQYTVSGAGSLQTLRSPDQGQNRIRPGFGQGRFRGQAVRRLGPRIPDRPG